MRRRGGEEEVRRRRGDEERRRRGEEETRRGGEDSCRGGKEERRARIGGKRNRGEEVSFSDAGSRNLSQSSSYNVVPNHY